MATGANCKISVGGHSITPFTYTDDLDWEFAVLGFAQRWDIPGTCSFLRVMWAITLLGLHR